MSCRLLGIALGLVACALVTWCNCSPHWADSLPITGNGAHVPFSAYRGLWKQCYGTGESGGSFSTNCNSYTQSISELARAGIVGQRALLVLSNMLVVTGLITGIISSNAVNIAPSEKTKRTASGGSAGQFFAAGTLTLIATVWAAVAITKNNDYGYGGGLPTGGNKGVIFTLGSALYVGFTGAAVSLAIGVIMTIGCCGDDDEDEDDVGYNQGYQTGGYATSQHSSMPGKEFV